MRKVWWKRAVFLMKVRWKRVAFLILAALTLLSGWYATPVRYRGTLTVELQGAEGVTENLFVDVRFRRSLTDYTVTTGRMLFRGKWYSAYQEVVSGRPEKQFADNFSDYALVTAYFREEDAVHPDRVTASFAKVRSSGNCLASFSHMDGKDITVPVTHWQTRVFP